MMTYAEMEQLAREISERLNKLDKGFVENGWEGHAQRSRSDAELYHIYAGHLMGKQV